MPEEEQKETEENENEMEQNMDESGNDVTFRWRSTKVSIKKDRRRTNAGVALTFQSSQKK